MTDVSRTYRVREFGSADSSTVRVATDDVLSGLLLYPLWMRLGWNDILQRYRRSLLGPFWLTASMAVMVIALGTIYGRLFKIDTHAFIPFLAAGLLIWNFFSMTITECGTLFTGSESYIKQVRLPFSLYVFRFTWSKLVILAHNAVVYIGVVLYFGVSVGWNALLIPVGFAMALANLIFTSLYLGIISARFRDIPQIISNFVQIAFFVTPIMWKPELLGVDSSLVALNPLFHLIEVIRAPMLGNVPSVMNYGVVGAITVINLIIAVYIFARFRARIAYWV